MATPVFYTVYIHTNTMTGEGYVGVTSGDVDERWRAHVRLARSGKKTRFHQAIATHGEHVFVCKILDVVVGPQDAAIAERFWIDYCQTHKNGYNMTRGGDVNPPHSAMAKKAICKALTAQWKNPMLASKRRERSPQALRNIKVARAKRQVLEGLRAFARRMEFSHAAA